MSVEQEVLCAVAELINARHPYAPVLIGSLPTDNSLSIAVGAGGLTRHMDLRAAVELDLVLNSKHTAQQVAADTLAGLHEYLGGLAAYPAGITYTITCIDTIMMPHYIGREAGGQWLYGSSLRVKYYQRG